MNRSQALLWKSDYVEGFCVIKPPAGIEKAYQLDEGISRRAGWPDDVVCKMDPEFPKDIALADNLYGAGAIIVSETLRAELERRQPDGIEFLPVGIQNHKGRRESSPYFLMNPLNVVECIDLEASQVRWNRTDPQVIKRCARLVIRPEALPKEASIFRPKFWPRLVLVRQEVCDSLLAGGFSGLFFQDPLEYMGMG